jgi:hypothetical protein
MLAFLQALSRPAFQASACAPRVCRVSIRLMQSDGAIITTLRPIRGRFHSRFLLAQEKQRDQLGGGAITDGETRAKTDLVWSGNGPLETATTENKFKIGEKVCLQNDKTKRWDDTGTILVIRDSGQSYLVERDISGDSVVRNNIYLKRLAPPVNLLNGKGRQVSPSAHFPLLPSPASLGVSVANPAELAALPAIHIRTSTQRRQQPVCFQP